jgi:transposase
MLTQEEDIDAHALRRRGWTISAIARHLGRDRKTVRAYLNGDRDPGVRRSSTPDWFAPFAIYCSARLVEDPHLWATTLFDEVQELGFTASYPTLTRELRRRNLRPACEPCHPATGRPVAVIEHPAGQETQWDWVDLPDPPAAWGWGKTVHLLVGSLSHSSRWRGVLMPSMDQAHLIDGLDRISRALGGVTRDWRFDRMATVVNPDTGRVQASFAAVAKHYGVRVVACPPRRGNRKGVVEKANHVAAQRVWRNMPDGLTVEQAQARLDAWCESRGDARPRTGPEGKTTVAALAAAEPLASVTTPFPAVLNAARRVSAQALVSWRGNRYSVPPQLAGAEVRVSVRLGSGHLEITTTTTTTTSGSGSGSGSGSQTSSNGRAGSALPVVIARHRLAPDGAGVMVRDHGHVIALEQAALAATTPAPPHRSKQRIPPGQAAQTAAAALRAAAGAEPPAIPPTPAGSTPPGPAGSAGSAGSEVVVDLARYVAAAKDRNTLS